MPIFSGGRLSSGPQAGGQGMFRFWLHFHPLLVLPVLIFIFSVSGGFIHWLQCHSPFRESFRKYALAPQIFATTSTLFALFAGFLLANLVAQKNAALQAVETETTALLALEVIAGRESESDALREALRAYAEAVVTIEWPLMLKEKSSPEAGRALLALIETVRNLEGVPSSIHGQMVSLVWRIADARSDRIAIVTTHSIQIAWTGLFLLGFLSQFAGGMAHLERWQPNAAAIAVFGAAAVIALWLIAIQDNPFRGPFPVSAAPMENVLGAFGE
ncbi:MAG TPA: hypothetical protein DCF73_13155 [Rhodobiaceae bacterium]|nr:hypothetical protein [Rhodobiaceae bacterium]